MINFTAIDFETANANIPCEIGVSVVRDGSIVETRSWYIKPSCFPYMNMWCQRVHGISNEMLADADTFDSVWYNHLKPYIQKELLIAHNAPFDIGVLKASLDNYQITYPEIKYLCSCQVSRNVWQDLPHHSLGFLCDEMGIYFTHHRAGADAEACAKLVLKAAHTLGANSVEELAELSRTKIAEKFKK